MIRVLLADDDTLLRSGLRVLIETEPDLVVVGEAGDGAEVVTQALTARPDVVVMDVRMPRMDGIEATRRLLDRAPAVRVLVLTTFDDDGLIEAALAAGASGFLLKRAAPADLGQAIRAVNGGEVLVLGEHARGLIARRAGRAAGDDPRRAALAALTRREAEILRLVAAGRSNAEIASTLVVTRQTVKTHVSAVLAKLGARDRTQAVVAAYETGFITPGDAPPGA